MARSFAQHCFSLFRGVRRGCATLFFSVVASPAILSCSDADADIVTMSVAGGGFGVRLLVLAISAVAHF